jgi:hypothetical protein
MITEYLKTFENCSLIELQEELTKKIKEFELLYEKKEKSITDMAQIQILIPYLKNLQFIINLMKTLKLEKFSC